MAKITASADDFDQNIEKLKVTVRQSFARIYASLKARELQTLRQLDVLRKQCQDNKDLKGNCVQNIQIRYDNEAELLENVSNFGIIDFEKLNFDSDIFLLEDYVSPNDDHMYSYKTIEEVTKHDDNQDLEAIEVAAIQQVTRPEGCVCFVNIRTEDVSKKFRDLELSSSPVKSSEISDNLKENDSTSTDNITEDEKSDSSDMESKKIDPTDDWLNSIKNQTEIEPAVGDVMEHSTITCS